MESRLPKPKFNLLKTNQTTVVGSELPNMSNVSSILPKATTTVTSTRTDLKTMGKSKTVLNINGKPVNENKPPARPLLTRSQTSVTVAKPVKRLGTATNAIEAKRANLRPMIKSTTLAQRPGATTRKAVGTGTAGAKPVAKPSKWDLKGRLEYSNAELASLKEKQKKYAHLDSEINELRSKQEEANEKIEQLETLKNTLTEELQTIRQSYTEVARTNDELKLKFEESETSRDRITETLREVEKVCESQKKLLGEHKAKFEGLERDLNEKKLLNVELSQKVKDLQALVHEMDRDRRVLHNTIQELKGNIRVFCRVRPRISRETSKIPCSINFIDESTMEISRADFSDTLGCGAKNRSTKQEFSFDKIFPPTATQAQVFEELSMLVQSALEGYNVCVFAYGQTGSGKTYTMEGGQTTETEGMIPRTVRHIFEEMKQFELLGWEYRIEASFLEIYNEHIVDLLDAQQKNHDIRMADSKGHDLYVTNLQVVEIHSPEELHVCLRTAQQNRAVAATFANERSSRSHSVAKIRLIGIHAEKEEQSIGNLNLVDLAGSERLKGEEAARTAETKNINKSLANLGNVILALLKKQDHIPYRNSKLTHLLMPSLGGNSKTLMLLNISPLDECFNETLNSLRFASSVNSCKTGNIKRSRTVINNTV